MMLSVQQAANRLQVTPRTVRKWAHEGRLKAARLCGPPVPCYCPAPYGPLGWGRPTLFLSEHDLWEIDGADVDALMRQYGGRLFA